MRYISTRNADISVSGHRAVVEGIAPGGGLFAPVELPKIENLVHIDDMPYTMRLAHVINLWLDEFSPDELQAVCDDSYDRFDDPAIAPVKALNGGRYALELWHGPTLAFKDMALQLLPGLMRMCADKAGEKRDILILVATSGDTGKAALEGFADQPGVRICVFYPENGVSHAQKLQMITQTGANVDVIAVRGNFDDAQTGVKKIFTDERMIDVLNNHSIRLSSANSINLGRLLPQVAYYAAAYGEMVKSGYIPYGAAINVCVPTGNFGNILAAYYAMGMGVPINRLVCASNCNNVLSDFINTGVYDANREFHLTSSPSMDILISSNLERLLFEISGRDHGQVRRWMDELSRTGRYALNAAQKSALKERFFGGWASEEEVAREIRRVYEEDNYLVDPHTAVAMKVARDYREKTFDNTPMLIASTASPFKFAGSVLRAIMPDIECGDDFACCRALSEVTGTEVPPAIAELAYKPILHNGVCDPADMERALLENLDIRL
ncbi:MAG: threonine synthase [Clostridia bacterium]|nr:threonine synthase [Clostridia bacterium]